MNTSVEIKVNGKPVKQYTHNSNTYIEARSGTEYSIRVTNDSFARKLAVITVDGLNVITGQPQQNGVGQGYIVNACSSIDIKGFRQDTDTVGAFKFCKKVASYCNEQGLKGNNGVIGVRLYDEVYKPIEFTKYVDPNPGYQKMPDYICSPRYTDNSRLLLKSSVCDTNSVESAYYSSTVAGASVPAAPDFDLGTTWGQKLNDAVTYTSFDTNENSFVDHIVYYDSRENLESIGISFKEIKQVCMPQAFGAFAKPPKGWKGK